MHRIRSFLALSIVVLLYAGIAAASGVVKIKLDDTIQPISDEYIGRAIEQARQTNADAVLIELRTPGGLVDSTRSIIEKILASPVPVIVYVAPSGARAASAGFFILEAADVAAMAPGTNTGAAHPVTLGGEKMDDVMKQKLENDAAAFMRSFVGPRGRNVALAESAVRESKSWTDKEALDLHLIDYVARDQDDLFKQTRRQAHQTVRWQDGHAAPGRRASGRNADDAEAAHSRLPARSQYRVSGAGRRRAGALRGVQPSGRNRARRGWCGVHSAGAVCAEPAADPLCGVHADHGSVRDVCAGGEVRHAWRSRHRWHRADDASADCCWSMVRFQRCASSCGPHLR